MVKLFLTWNQPWWEYLIPWKPVLFIYLRPRKIITTHLGRFLKCRAHPRPTESERLGMGAENLDLQRESLVGVQRGLTGTSAMFRKGGAEGCQRKHFGEDTKLGLEDCSGVRYTMDPLEWSRCGRCFPQMHGKQTPGKQRSQSHALGTSLTQLSSQPCVLYLLSELISKLPMNLSPPVLPTLSHIHVTEMSEAFPPLLTFKRLPEIWLS